MLWFELQELHDFIPYLVSAGLLFAITCISLLHLSREYRRQGDQGDSAWPEYVPQPMRSVAELGMRSVLLMLRRFKMSPDDDSDKYHSSFVLNVVHIKRGGYIWLIQKDSFLFKNGRYGYMQ